MGVDRFYYSVPFTTRVRKEWGTFCVCPCCWLLRVGGSDDDIYLCTSFFFGWGVNVTRVHSSLIPYNPTTHPNPILHTHTYTYTYAGGGPGVDGGAIQAHDGAAGGRTLPLLPHAPGGWSWIWVESSMWMLLQRCEPHHPSHVVNRQINSQTSTKHPPTLFKNTAGEAADRDGADAHRVRARRRQAALPVRFFWGGGVVAVRRGLAWWWWPARRPSHPGKPYLTFPNTPIAIITHYQRPRPVQSLIASPPHLKPKPR